MCRKPHLANCQHSQQVKGICTCMQITDNHKERYRGKAFKYQLQDDEDDWIEKTSKDPIWSDPAWSSCCSKLHIFVYGGWHYTEVDTGLMPDGKCGTLMSLWGRRKQLPLTFPLYITTAHTLCWCAFNMCTICLSMGICIIDTSVIFI